MRQLQAVLIKLYLGNQAGCLGPALDIRHLAQVLFVIPEAPLLPLPSDHDSNTVASVHWMTSQYRCLFYVGADG